MIRWARKAAAYKINKADPADCAVKSVCVDVSTIE